MTYRTLRSPRGGGRSFARGRRLCARWTAALATLPLLAGSLADRASAQSGGIGQTAQAASGGGVLAPATAVIGARASAPASRSGRSEAATGRVTGTVYDAATGEPLVGGQVAVRGMPLGNVSDDAGAYFINNVPVGRQTFTVEYLGYEPQSKEHQVEGGISTTLDFSLEPTPIAIDEVVVEEEAVRDLSEYAERTPLPTLKAAEARPLEVAESDTSLMEQWHRSMRDLTVVHEIEYPLAGVKVYYHRPTPRRWADPVAARPAEDRQAGAAERPSASTP
ncbi:MAG: carboxypeptidase-like regulatory domain-containing protein [Gemmatimonadota bacterium]